MNLGAPELLIVVIIAVFFVLPVWGIIDAALKPDEAWARASQSKVAWILLQVFLGGIGSVVYLLAIRPKLTAA